MSEQVQSLIDRIRREAVDAAERQARDILAQARERAEALEARARASAAAATEAAERAAADALARGRASLRQAARDVLLELGARFEDMVLEILARGVHEALEPEVVEKVLLSLADWFGTNGIAEGPLELGIGDSDRERLTQFVMTELRRRLEQGVTISIDPRLQRGFRLTYSAGGIQHDFTTPAIAAALAPLVRPQLAELVMQAALGEDAEPRAGAARANIAAGHP